MTYGYLLTIGSAEEKAAHLSTLCFYHQNQKRAYACHDFISEEEMYNVWRQLCRFATLYLIEFGQIYSAIPSKFTHSELADLETKIDRDLWHSFAQQVFKGEPSIRVSDFTQRCLDHANYIFDAQLLREKITGGCAGIPTVAHAVECHEETPLFLSNSPPRLHTYSHFESSLPFHNTHVLSFDQMLS